MMRRHDETGSGIAAAVRAGACRMLMLATLLAPGACTVVKGGEPESLDAMSVGSLAEGLASSTVPSSSLSPAAFAAAHRSLALDRDEWRDAVSGAWGTVRRTGPDDARACTPAELTVHDYRGARLESHVLCPVLGAVMIP